MIKCWLLIAIIYKWILKSIYLFLFYLYIYPPDLQESDKGAYRVGNYLDLLVEMPRYCCLLVI